MLTRTSGLLLILGVTSGCGPSAGGPPDSASMSEQPPQQTAQATTAKSLIHVWKSPT